MDRILLNIDFQRSFMSSNGAKVAPEIERVALKYKWDKIIQTLWFNSKDSTSPYVTNLGYTECSPEQRASGLVRRFKNSIMLPRYDAYSCMNDELLSYLRNVEMIYVTGWETDACVLATCFALFDRGYPFKVVTNCVHSKSADAHEAALVVMKRNFGECVLVTSNEI